MLPAIWPYAGPMVRKAIARTGLSDFAAVEAEVMAGTQLLWIASDDGAIQAVATTQLSQAGNRKVCVLVACSGSGRERWLPLIAGLEVYAKAEGCAAMRIFGRKGWERVLDNYRARFAILEKELA